MVRYGIYDISDEPELQWFLHERYNCVSQAALLHQSIMEPIINIKERLQEKHAHPYVAIESYRSWVEFVRSHIPFIDLPEPGGFINVDYCDIYWIEDDGWALFGDEADVLYDLLINPYKLIEENCDVDYILDRLHDELLERVSGNLYFWCNRSLVVLRSDTIGHCIAEGDKYSDATKEGGCPTYLAPPGFIKEYTDYKLEMETEEDGIRNGHSVSSHVSHP